MGVVFVVGVLMVVAFAVGLSSIQRRRGALSDIALAIGGTAVGNRATGVHHGVATRFAFTKRSSGKSSENWTEITAELPAKYPLEIFVRRHAWLDHGKIERGTMVDVVLGDPAFDDAFLVEAAPADVARILIDAPARSLLAGEPVVELSTTDVDGQRVLKLATRRWIETSSEAVRLIDATTLIASRVRDAFAQADAAVPVAETGSPYRAIAAPQLDRANDRSAEVETVRALRAERRVRGTALAFGLVIAAILAAVAMAAR